MIGSDPRSSEFHNTLFLYIGNKVVELLTKKKKQIRIEWDERSFEHFFNYKDEKKQLHVVYYPTLKVH